MPTTHIRVYRHIALYTYTYTHSRTHTPLLHLLLPLSSSLCHSPTQQCCEAKRTLHRGCARGRPAKGTRAIHTHTHTPTPTHTTHLHMCTLTHVHTHTHTHTRR